MARKPAKKAEAAVLIEQPPKPGRPSTYSEEVVTAILARLMTGQSLRQICRDEQMPERSTVYEWLAKDEHKSFADRYARAREIQADETFEEMAEIADDGSNDWMELKNADGENIGWKMNGESVQRSKIRLDERKWRLSKMLPKRYGEKVETTIKGDADAPLEVEDRSVARQIAFLLANAVRPSAQPE